MDKIIDIDDRVPARRRRRKIRTNIKFAVLITIFLLIIFGLLYFQSSYSKIQTIELKGNDLYTVEDYEKLLPFSEGDSIWGFNKRKVEKELSKNQWIKSVSVKRDLLTKVKIEIEEWPKIAYVGKSYSFYPMLENGYVLEEARDDELIDSPVFIKFDDEKLRKKLVKQLTKLKPEVLALISQINASPTESDPYSITLYMNDGYEVRAEISTFASKLNYYPSIIAQIEHEEEFEKGVIDIEVGSYFRPYSREYDKFTIPLEDDEENTEEGDEGDE